MSPLVIVGEVQKVVLHWALLQECVLSPSPAKSDSKLQRLNSAVWDIVCRPWCSHRAQDIRQPAWQPAALTQKLGYGGQEKYPQKTH